MKKIVLIGISSILLLDIFGSIASNQLQFSYTALWPISLILYALFGYLSSRKNIFKNGAITGGIIGFIDTTIGWKISIWLNAYSPDRYIEPKSMTTWITTIIIGTILAILIGFLGGLLNKLKKK